MADLQLTALARLPLQMLSWAGQRGLDPDELARLAGIDHHDLADPDHRVPVDAVWGLWRVILERTDNPHIGLEFGCSMTIRESGVVGYTVYYSPTLDEALHRLVRYSRVVNEILRLHLVGGAKGTRLVTEKEPRFDELRQPVDARLSWILAAAREVTGARIMPLEVAFPYSRPRDLTEHTQMFGATLRFDEPEAAIMFDNSDLERQVVVGDATLSGYLEQLADGVLSSIAKGGTFVDRVRATIWGDMSSGKVDTRHIASRLHVSGRSLQRRLAAAGTSFSAELESMRRASARKLLEDPALAISELAFLLGYSEPSAFYRAFRRWEGTSPSDFREQTRSPTGGAAKASADSATLRDRRLAANRATRSLEPPDH